MTATAEQTSILAEIAPGGVGRITLNRPAALNAIDLAMVRAMTGCLRDWAGDEAVRTVLIQGAGTRGLCAGGDVRALHDAIRAGNPLPDAFLREEYSLNARIAAYPKPVVAIMDGLVMGGGIGVSGHASRRVVTERSALAMPEVAIGFVPDVGGTYLLSRAPGELGTHLALTGGRMSAADAFLCGFADFFVPTARLGHACAAPEDLESFAEPAPEATLARHRGWIDRCYAFDNVEAILDALDGSGEPEALSAASTIRANSPTALKVTLRALREARGFGRLEPCLVNEFRIGMTMSVPEGDFVEGVRAALVDRDRAPKWRPAELAGVSAAEVERHLASRGAADLRLGDS